MMNRMQLEQRALKASIAINIFMGILGLGFAILINSNAIILDGIYSLILAIMAFLTYKVCAVVSLPDDETHPLGYQNYEPFLNTIKGLIVFVVCIAAFATSVKTLFSGGRDISLGYAIIYSVIAAVGCFIMALYLREAARKLKSPLLDVEGKGWLVDGAISAVVGLAFIIGYGLENTQFGRFIPYLDPLLTMGLAVGIVIVPYKTIKEGVSELLYMAPNQQVQSSIKKRYHEAVRGYPFLRSRLRIMKVGRLLYTSATVLLPEEIGWTIDEMDNAREEISKKVALGEEDFSMEVFFTTREEWL